MNPQISKMYIDKINLIKGLLTYFEKKGYEVENSHKREKWGEEWAEPELCVHLDYEFIKKTDIMVAIPGSPPSGGSHIELGWASFLGKKIIMLLKNGKQYSNLILGLYTITDVDYVWYDDIEECLKKLDKIL